MVIDEANTTALRARLMIERILLKAGGTEALTSAVIVDEVPAATATIAVAAAVAVTPAGTAATQPVNLATELRGAKTQRALRCSNIVGTGGDKSFGEPNRDRRAVWHLAAEHAGAVMQDPVEFSLRDGRAEHRRDPINLGGRQAGPQVRDTVANLGGVVDVGFGFAPATQQAITVARAINQLVHRGAARAFADGRLPALQRTGTADALVELPRVGFRIIAVAHGTQRRSHPLGAEPAQTHNQRLDVRVAVATGGPGEHATVALQRSGQPLQLRHRQAHALDRGAHIAASQVRLDIADRSDDHRHELAAVSAHPRRPRNPSPRSWPARGGGHQVRES
ncbi:hypothetical protein [Mycolicibacter algericus]|uniref:hypothetical protein n=1 Tax=Mycolicibacter algericus TaxID=1288388 RepID=UPI003C720104